MSGKAGDDCIPPAHGLYYATHRKYGWRRPVWIGVDGFGHTRAYVPRFTSSFNVEEFEDYSAALEDPGPRPKCRGR